MKTQQEIEKKLHALKSTKSLMQGTDTAKMIDAGIRQLKWVLGDSD